MPLYISQFNFQLNNFSRLQFDFCFFLSFFFIPTECMYITAEFPKILTKKYVNICVYLIFFSVGKIIVLSSGFSSFLQIIVTTIHWRRLLKLYQWCLSLFRTKRPLWIKPQEATGMDLQLTYFIQFVSFLYYLLSWSNKISMI